MHCSPKVAIQWIFPIFADLKPENAGCKLTSGYKKEYRKRGNHRHTHHSDTIIKRSRSAATLNFIEPRLR